MLLILPVAYAQTFAINGNARTIAVLIPMIFAAAILLFSLMATMSLGDQPMNPQATTQAVTTLIVGIITSVMMFIIITAIVDAILLVEI